MAPGSLQGILLTSAAGQVAGVRLKYQPIANPEPLLLGRAPREALQTIDLLFGVCRYAHQFAARQALELFESGVAAQRLRCTVQAESVREALLALGWRWPTLIDQQPLPRELMMAAVALLQIAARGDQEQLCQQGRVMRSQLAELLGIDGCDVQACLQAMHSGGVAGGPWLRSMLGAIRVASDGGLPSPPDCVGVDPEQRFIEQLAQCFKALDEVIDIAGAPGADHLEQVGVATHRGQLIHTATLSASGAIDSYHISAPTTRRFTDLGWAIQGLQRLKSKTIHEAEQQFGNWLGAMDPCGGASLERGLADA